MLDKPVFVNYIMCVNNHKRSKKMTGVKFSLMMYTNRGDTREYIPVSCAIEKPKYIQSRKEVIRKMDEEIRKQKEIMQEITNTEDLAYKTAAKRLKRCQDIKKTCEDSIELITEQMAIEKKSRIRAR